MASSSSRVKAEADLKGGAGGVRPRFFCNHLFSSDHFEELHIVFIEVKLIINNSPLTYVYPKTIKTYLTPKHLLFGRQLLCCSNTSPVIRNLTVLSSTADKITASAIIFGKGGDMNM